MSSVGNNFSQDIVGMSAHDEKRIPIRRIALTDAVN